MTLLFAMQAIINENDLDANGCLSFDEFLISVAANIKVLSDEEHRYTLPAPFKELTLDFRSAFMSRTVIKSYTVCHVARQSFPYICE